MGQFSQYVLVHSSFQSFEVVIQKAIELYMFRIIGTKPKCTAKIR